MSKLARIKQAVILAFIGQTAAINAGGDPGFLLLENPTEELVDAGLRGRSVRLHGADGNGAKARGVEARLEENYLFSTRRFPADTTNVLPAAPHLPADNYAYFANAVGQSGDSNGFPAGFTLQQTETNMDIPSQIPKGKDFVFNQVGISFNTEALSADIEQLLDAGALRYEKQGGQFTLRHGPARFWPGAQGVSGFSTNQGSEAAHNGVADARAARTLRIPRVIRNQETFQYLYNVPRPTRATDGAQWQLSQFTLMTVWLWGGQRDAIPV